MVRRDLLAAVEMISPVILGQAALLDSISLIQEKPDETRGRAGTVPHQLASAREANVEFRACLPSRRCISHT